MDNVEIPQPVKNREKHVTKNNERDSLLIENIKFDDTNGSKHCFFIKVCFFGLEKYLFCLSFYSIQRNDVCDFLCQIYLYLLFYRIWCVKTGEMLNTLIHHCEAVLHLRFSDGIMVTCSKVYCTIP